MATAARGTVGFIPETPEEQRALDNLRASRQALQDALLNRQELFDPTLLAIAQGFLAPTKSGGFGESLGNVAAQVGPVQQKERERELQMYQIRAELAAQEAAEAQAMQEARLLRQMPSVFGGAAPPPAAAGAPAAGAAAGATPGAAPSAAPSATPSGEVSTSNRNQILQYVENLSRSRSPALRDAAKQTLDLLKFQREGIEMREGIVIDKNRVDANGMPMILADLRQKQEPTEIVYQGKARTIPMTGLEIQQFKAAKEQGPEAEKKYFDTYLAGRRSGPEAMPFGGERGMFAVRMPDPANPAQLLTLTGEATARQRAMLEQAEERAFETGDFADLRRIYTQVTGQGQYTARPPAAAPAAPAGAPAGRPAAQPSAREAAVAPATPGEQPIMDRIRAASAKMADAVANNDAAAERAARAEINGLRADLAREQGVPAGLAVDPELANLPLAKQTEIIVDRIKASDKEATEQMGLIRQIGAPQNVVASNRRLEEIRDTARRSPQAVGLLVQQGLLPALMKAANEGFRVGPYQVSAPVEAFLTGLKLPTNMQEDGRRIAMLLDEEFFNRAASNKSVLGPQISNADTVLMKSPLARPSDSARIIAYWATHGLLTNRQVDDMYNAARQYPSNRSPKDFIGSDVRRIMDSYNPLFDRIRQDFAAGR